MAGLFPKVPVSPFTPLLLPIAYSPITDAVVQEVR